MALSLSIIDPAVHLFVPLHEGALKNLHELQRDNQTDWNESVVQQKIRSQRNCCYLQALKLMGLSDDRFKLKVRLTFQVAVNGATQGAQQLEHKNHQNNLVDHVLDI
jgi:molecular chaperone DnaK (HSP70)